MKKVIVLFAIAAIMASCNPSEVESMCETYKKESAEKNKNKTEFEIFNDRFQKGKNLSYEE